MSTNDQLSASSLSIELNLPLHVEVLSVLPGDEVLNRWRVDNEKTMHAINVMEDILPTDSDLLQISPDAARLEIKLDLLTNLLVGC